LSPNAAFLLRMEEAHFRQIWRTNHLLMKAQRRQNVDAGKPRNGTYSSFENGNGRKKDTKNAGISYDLYENKG
jgi:hypothetical protein